MTTCPTCGQDLRASALAQDLADTLDRIVFTLRAKQPEPRSASVTYLAGYARAMDDMRQAILSAARVASSLALPESDLHELPPSH